MTNEHHPSCTPNDRDLVWHCNQCGLNEPAGDIEAATAKLREELAQANDPSEVAKQAAEQLEAEWDTIKVEQVIQQAIDAATAKLRAENKRLTEALQIIRGAGYTLTLSDGTNVIDQALSPERSLGSKNE